MDSYTVPKNIDEPLQDDLIPANANMDTYGYSQRQFTKQSLKRKAEKNRKKNKAARKARRVNR